MIVLMLLLASTPPFNPLQRPPPSLLSNVSFVQMLYKRVLLYYPPPPSPTLSFPPYSLNNVSFWLTIVENCHTVSYAISVLIDLLYSMFLNHALD